jgi:hypothetical protein
MTAPSREWGAGRLDRLSKIKAALSCRRPNRTGGVPMAARGRTRVARPVTLAKSRQAGNGPILAAATVEDPLEPGARLVVARNVGEHPLTYLRAKGRLDGASSRSTHDRLATADARFAAGDSFRQHYERAMIGASRAIDYSRVKVDGGSPSDPLSESVQRSHAWLRDVAACRELGQIRYAVLVAICGEGRLIPAAANHFGSTIGLTGRRAEGHVSGLLIEALDVLAEHLGLNQRPRAGARMVSTGEITITGPGREWQIGRLGDMVERAPHFAGEAWRASP